MALPLVYSSVACADFSRTVLPYVNQFYDLPREIFHSTSSLQSAKELYLTTNPLVTAFAISLLLFPIFLVVSEINKNYSQVDRCWSLLPTVYNAHYVLYAFANGIPVQRLLSLLIVCTVWSVSLSLGFKP